MFTDRDGDGSPSNGDWANSVPFAVYDSSSNIVASSQSGHDGVAVISVDGPVTVAVAQTLEPVTWANSPISVELREFVSGGESATLMMDVGRCVEPCGALLPPDLIPLIELPTSTDDARFVTSPLWSVDKVSSPGSTWLRIASLTANLGPGPLIVGRGSTEPDATGASSYQRLLTSSGSHVDIASAVFPHHSEHPIAHIDAFERIELVGLDGTSLVEVIRISRCLDDMFVVDQLGARHAPVRFVPDPIDCSPAAQGVNPGFATYSNPTTDDDSINITGIAAGDYQLRITVDPLNLVTESDETNNVVIMPIRLS